MVPATTEVNERANSNWKPNTFLGGGAARRVCLCLKGCTCWGIHLRQCSGVAHTVQQRRFISNNQRKINNFVGDGGKFVAETNLNNHKVSSQYQCTSTKPWHQFSVQFHNIIYPSGCMAQLLSTRYRRERPWVRFPDRSNQTQESPPAQHRVMLLR